MDDLSIDKHNLQRECLRQVSLVVYWGKLLAKRKLELDKLKAEFELIEARLTVSLGKAFEKKPTVGELKALVLKHSSYQAKQAEVLEAKRRVDSASAINVALEHRRKSLDLIVQLLTHEFHSTNTGTRVPKG